MSSGKNLPTFSPIARLSKSRIEEGRGKGREGETREGREERKKGEREEEERGEGGGGGRGGRDSFVTRNLFNQKKEARLYGGKFKR